MADLLEVDHLSAGYGAAQVLHGISLAVPAGGALAVLGRNGTGKTTLLRSLLGLTRHAGGTIRLAGQDITRLPPSRRAQAGLGWVPQERNIFRSLTVRENLTAVARPGPWNAARIFRLFPRLAERQGNLGGQLSGGEQQMLAIGRALVLNPKLLLLDEPTEGLAPIIVAEVLAALARVIRDDGTAAVVVEQHARTALAIAPHAAILERGTIAYAGPSATLLAEPQIMERLLGVG